MMLVYFIFLTFYVRKDPLECRKLVFSYNLQHSLLPVLDNWHSRKNLFLTVIKWRHKLNLLKAENGGRQISNYHILLFLIGMKGKPVFIVFWFSDSIARWPVFCLFFFATCFVYKKSFESSAQSWPLYILFQFSIFKFKLTMLTNLLFFNPCLKKDF